MALSRFYLPAAQWLDASLLTLCGDEARHCLRVMRLGVGDGIEVFDGEGRVARATITKAGRDTVSAAVEEVTRHLPLAHEVHLMPALIKGEAFEWLIEKAVELGAASVCPVLAAHGVVRWDADQQEKKLAKWCRQMIEAAKQCHTPFVPQLHPPAPLAELLARVDGQGEVLRLIGALSGETRPLVQTLAAWGERPRRALVLTGPEGDWTNEELDAALASGFSPVSLGPLILRAETASLATLAVLTQTWSS